MAKSTTNSDEVIVPETPVVEDPTPVVEAEVVLDPIGSLSDALAAFKQAVSASESPFKSHMLLKIEEMARYI